MMSLRLRSDRSSSTVVVAILVGIAATFVLWSIAIVLPDVSATGPGAPDLGRWSLV